MFHLKIAIGILAAPLIAAATASPDAATEAKTLAISEVYRQLNLYPGSQFRNVEIQKVSRVTGGFSYLITGDACYGGVRPCNESEYFPVVVRVKRLTRKVATAEVFVRGSDVGQNAGMRTNLCE